MNILHIVHSFDVSGRSRVIHDICRLLPADEYRFAVASLSGSCGYRADDVEVVCLDKGAGFSLGTLFRLVRLIRTKDISILHSHGRGALLYAALAKRMAGANGLVHTVHRADGDRLTGNKLLARYIQGATDRVVAVSNAAGREFSRVNKWPLSGIQTIYNGVDIARFAASKSPESPNPRIPESSNHPILESSISPVIGTVANFSGDKDFETLLKGFAGVLKRRPDARLLMVGNGPKVERIRQLATISGIGANVEFLGFVKDLERVLAGLDVFVLSTTTEGLGLAILEAMAAGLPVVASRVGGIPEIIEHGVNGILFEAGNGDDLARSIEAILADRNLRKRLIENGRRRVAEKFSLAGMREGYARVYESLHA